MATENYFEVENNVVVNVVLWDGDVNTWQPPASATMLVASTTPAMIWAYDKDTKDYYLNEVVGVGTIGYTWDGSVLMTNEPKPTEPPYPVPLATPTT